jgi:hypothetical protein
MTNGRKLPMLHAVAYSGGRWPSRMVTECRRLGSTHCWFGKSSHSTLLAPAKQMRLSQLGFLLVLRESPGQLAPLMQLPRRRGGRNCVVA